VNCSIFYLPWRTESQSRACPLRGWSSGQKVSWNWFNYKNYNYNNTDPRESIFLCKRLSVALQRLNSIILRESCVVEDLNRSMEESVRRTFTLIYCFALGNQGTEGTTQIITVIIIRIIIISVPTILLHATDFSSTLCHRRAVSLNTAVILESIGFLLSTHVSHRWVVERRRITYSAMGMFLQLTMLLLIDWLTALRHISTGRLLVPRNAAK